MTLTPIKSIRAKCLDCCCAQPSEVRLCPSIKCALHAYRMGKRPVGLTRKSALLDETPTLAGEFSDKGNVKEVIDNDISTQ